MRPSSCCAWRWRWPGGGGGAPVFPVSRGRGPARFPWQSRWPAPFAGGLRHSAPDRDRDPLVIIYYFSLIGVLGSLPALLRTGLLPTPGEWLLLLGVGLTTQAGQLCLTRALYLERAGRVSSAGLVQIVFAGVWGVLCFGEVPDAAAVAGAVLIVVAVLALGPIGRALAPVPGSPSIAAERPRPPG
jgi:drug/metabolite transporter (DMT)-like permease